MGQVYRLIALKRWYIFLVIGCIGFFMIFLTFYETSNLFRNAPRIVGLYTKRDKDIYEIRLEPFVSNGVVVENSEEELEVFYQSVHQTFFDGDQSEALFANKWGYIEGKELTPLRFEQFQKNSTLPDSRVIDELFLDDLLVFNFSEDSLMSFAKELEPYHIRLQFVTLEQRFAEECDYYVVNFLIGFAVASALFSFVLMILYWVLQGMFVLCQDEIRLFRILGATKRRLSLHFSCLAYLPFLVATILVLLLVYVIQFGATVYDIIYLLICNALIFQFIWLMIHRRLRRFLNA